MEHWMDTEQYSRRDIGKRSPAAIVSSNAVVRAEEPVVAEGLWKGQDRATHAQRRSFMGRIQ
jgi:hypothetical protein